MPKASRRTRVLLPLSLKNSPNHPYLLFEQWFESAITAGLKHPNAMTLATASGDGRPAARIVLLKGIDSKGLTFFTNYRSRKSAELDANPRAALVFYWSQLDLQIRIAGKVKRVSARESDEYFATRPRESQIGAHASPQSRPMADKSALVAEFRRLSRKFDGMEVPRPKHWGGFRLEPGTFEFWKAGDFRLHDRLVYTRKGSGWRKSLLFP